MTSKKTKETPGQSKSRNQNKKPDNSQSHSEKEADNSQSQKASSAASISDSSPQAQDPQKVETEAGKKSDSETGSTKKENENEKKASPEEANPASNPDDETEAAQSSIFGALLGKMLSTGESQIKRAAELKLPREVINFSKEQMKGLKHDMVKTVGSEVSHFLKNLNLGKELVKVLTYLTFEVKMQIRLVPSDENKLKLKPESKIKVVSKKNKKPKDNEPQQ